jgi:hypothetical protein
MGRQAIVFSFAALAGCSFVDDFDRFRAIEEGSDAAQHDAAGDATGETRNDASTPRDAALDGASEDTGPSAMIDGSIADAAAVDAFVPPPVCGGTVCDDGDPCTRDDCVGSQCTNTVIDGDRDGYSPLVCKTGSAARGGDCNDADGLVHPGATEVCDDLDNDCNTIKDDGVTKIQCFPDVDRDDFANLDGVPVAVCATCPSLTVAVSDPTDRTKHDCWDDPATDGAKVYPGQTDFFPDGYGPGAKSERKWDFNCNGMIDRKYSALVGGCAGVLGLICESAQGFVDDQLPDCGETGTYQRCSGDVLKCTGPDESLKQLCN